MPSKKLSKAEIVKVNELRQVLKQHAVVIDDRLALTITSVASLDRQVIALEAFRKSVDSIKGWDFVGDLPLTVLDLLDETLGDVKKIRGQIEACKITLQQGKNLIRGRDAGGAEFTADPLQLKAVADQLVGIIRVTDETFKDLMAQAVTNAQACDTANNAISTFITDTAKRAVVMLKDKDIERIDLAKEVIGTGLEVANQCAGEPMTEKCIAGCKLLFTLVTEAVKEGVIQYKASQMDSHSAFSQLGAFDIAIAGAKDTMRVIDIFLDGMGVVVPYWTYIQPGLHTFAEVYVNASVTRAQQLEKEAASGGPTSFWKGFKDGLEEGFEKEATTLMVKTLLPPALLTSTIQIVVKAFAEQVVGRMDIEPAQSHPGVELEAYIAELKNCYKAGLTTAQPEVQKELADLGAGTW